MIRQIASGANFAGAPRRGASLRRAATPRNSPHPATGGASDRPSRAKSPVAEPSRRSPGRLRPAERCVPAPPVSVALHAPAPGGSVPVHAQPAVESVKPCEPARYHPLQVKRGDPHRCWIHAYGLQRADPVFGRTVANPTRFAMRAKPSRHFRQGVLVPQSGGVGAKQVKTIPFSTMPTSVHLPLACCRPIGCPHAANGIAALDPPQASGAQTLRTRRTSRAEEGQDIVYTTRLPSRLVKPVVRIFGRRNIHSQRPRPPLPATAPRGSTRRG
jgi:hypothetical protein